MRLTGLKMVATIAVVNAVAVFMLNGCGDYTGDTSSTYNESDYINDSSTNYICTDNNGTNCYTPDYSSYVSNDGTIDEVADEPSGDFDSEYTASECAANGYFFCSIEQKCLNIPADGGTCNN